MNNIADILESTPLSIEGYRGIRHTIKMGASLTDTLRAMQRIARRDTYQVRELAKELKGESVEQSARNIWNYLRKNTRYKLDTEGVEELRTPARSLVDGRKGLSDKNYGIDCDDYTILISSLLLNMGIPHEYRVAAYSKKGVFEHIYPVAINSNDQSYIIDCVPEIPRFNYEAKPIIQLKTIPMQLQELSGITDAKQTYLEELTAPLNLSGLEEDEHDLEDSFLSGLKEVETKEQADIVLEGIDDTLELIERGLHAQVNSGLSALLEEKKNPSELSSIIDVDSELEHFYNVMDSWEDDSDRMQAIAEAIEEGSAYENFFESLLESIEQLDATDHPLSGMDEPIYLAKDSSPIDLSEHLDDSLEGLGKRKKRGFFKKLFKKVGKGLKKAVKAVVKFNPLTIAARAATLVVLKTNLFKIGSSLIYGYLSEGQAKAQGLDLDEWRKVVKAKEKLEKFFVKLGGDKKKFKKALISGKAAKKTGVKLDGLGAAATTTAASGFIAFAKNLLNKINPAKLFKKVKDKIKNNKSAEGDFADPADFPADNSSTQTTTEQTNLPSVTTPQTMDPTNLPSAPVQEGFKEKVMGFYSQHKKKLMVIGVGGVIALVVLIALKKIKSKKKRSLAGVKAARTRARNAASRRRAVSTRKRSTKSASKSLKGSTTIIRVPSKSVNKSRISKRSNGARLKAMHKKAKQLQKQHPKAKYATLLRKASKLI